MRFQKVYIEITNICGLACSFCPTKTLPSKIMPLSFFEEIVPQISHFTKEIALHVMGDPLTLSNLQAYLDIALKHHLLVNITTSGFHLKNHANLFHPSLKQINISLNSFNKNTPKMSFEEYMQTIFNLYEKRKNEEIFINLRLWNLDENNTEESYNKEVFEALEAYFNIKIIPDGKTFRLAKKVLLHFDNYFEWPSLQSEHFSHSFCHGLSSQIAILCDGRVVPCCLDADGIMSLGNLHVNTLEEILHSKKAQDIINGFKEKKAVEELCQKCSFKERFHE
jgi:radical SAM protein with 4Fe4S-binding SPASM domain